MRKAVGRRRLPLREKCSVPTGARSRRCRLRNTNFRARPPLDIGFAMSGWRTVAGVIFPCETQPEPAKARRLLRRGKRSIVHDYGMHCQAYPPPPPTIERKWALAWFTIAMFENLVKTFKALPNEAAPRGDTFHPIGCLLVHINNDFLIEEKPVWPYATII